MGKKSRRAVEISSMQALVLYLNELCLAPEPTELDQEYRWTMGAAGLAEAIDSVLAIRPDGNVALPPGSWDADCGGFPLRTRFQQRMSPDKYRRLLVRIRQLSNANVVLEREVQFSGREALGLTLADAAAQDWTHSWAVSLSLSNSPWLHHSVPAQRFVLNDQGMLDGPTECVVGHLSCGDHVKHWQAEIRDWGSKVATSSELAVINGHPIVMYPGPLEHGPAHVHLLESRGSRVTLAKYEINQFKRYKGRPDWDIEMRAWINTNRDQLLRSWDRCQRGGHPYALE